MDVLSTGSSRRGFFVRIISAIHTVIGGTLGVVVAGAVVSPAFTRRDADWLFAARLDSLRWDEPTTVTLRVERQDGYAQTIERRTLFLVRTGESEVMALDSTCPHLGCRVGWDPDSRELKCPCHGGTYDLRGHVKAGPPPMALATVQTRIDRNQVLVRV